MEATIDITPQDNPALPFNVTSLVSTQLEVMRSNIEAILKRANERIEDDDNSDKLFTYELDTEALTSIRECATHLRSLEIGLRSELVALAVIDR